eukprot:1150705-Pelagomonas_calceolata.AAC.2
MVRLLLDLLPFACVCCNCCMHALQPLAGAAMMQALDLGLRSGALKSLFQARSWQHTQRRRCALPHVRQFGCVTLKSNLQQ